MANAVRETEVVERIIFEHNRVLEAVFNRDPELAASLMEAHLSNAAKRLFSVVGSDQAMVNYLGLLLHSATENANPMGSLSGAPDHR